MKVLIWTQYFWPENFHINSVARALFEQGVEVTVLTGKPNYPEGKLFPGYRAGGVHREKYSGFDVIRIPLRERGIGSAKGLALNYLSFIISGYLFAPFVLRGKKFDVVFVYAPSPLLQALPAIFVARLKQAPLVLWVQDLWPEALHATEFVKNRRLLHIVRMLVRGIYRFSDSILIQSEAFRSSIERLAIPKEKIRFFPNAAEDTFSETSRAHQDSGLAQDAGQSFSILFAGNIGTAQSCETIVEAAILLQNVQSIRFHFFGSGSMAETISKSISENKLANVVMMGRVSSEKMASIYESASVLLLSLRDDPALSATIPSKLQSYLAAGKPIIVSSNGESANIIGKANAGLSCPAGDAQALAKAVLRLYEMLPAERARLGMNGRKYFMDNFYMPDRVAELVAHFNDIARQ
jgi:glycosyltransferase involved in cell wall biosynthesis